MLDKVRGKFFVVGIHKSPYQGATPRIELGAVSADDGEKGENTFFNQATPFGEIKMDLTNPAVAEFFKLGDAFYVDFVRVVKPST